MKDAKNKAESVPAASERERQYRIANEKLAVKFSDTGTAQVASDTPTPLIVCEPYTNRNVFPIGYVRADGATVIVAEVNGAGGTEAENRRHATFIVRACNAHADLLEALRAAEVRLRAGYHPDKFTEAECERMCPELAQVRAAIAKAERGQA